MKTFLQTLIIGFFLSLAFFLSAQTVDTVFTANGIFEVPAGVTEITVQLWGGGGAGGGVTNNNNNSGGGGAGGSYRIAAIPVNPVDPINVTVGLGGTGQSGGAGNTGGNSTFSSDPPVSAIGGNGGLPGLGNNGVGLGAPLTGGITFNGGAGSAGVSNARGGAGGGGAGNGGSGSGAIEGAGGFGGAGAGLNPLPGGTGAIGTTVFGDGEPASGLAAGGGGARNGSGVSSQIRTGGNGGNGLVIVSYTIFDPCATLTLAEGDVIQPSCFGGNDGFISVVVTGGTTPYTFSWENSASTDSASSLLQAGSYKVYVEDAANCIDSLTILLGQPSQLTITLDTVINETCPGAANGSIEVTATGGTGMVLYLWSNGETSDSIAAPTVGFYSVTATDANGCTAEATYEVQTANQTPVVTCPSPDTISLCFGDVIDLDTFGFSPSGGTYVINDFSNGSIFNSADENTGINNVWYVYTDPNTGCIDSCLFVVFVNFNPGVQASSNSPVCEGNTIELTTIASGGAGTLTFAWEGPDNFSSTLSSPEITEASVLNFGIYSVTVTDANGCTDSDFVEVTEQLIGCCPGPGTMLYVTPNGTGDGLTLADPTNLVDALDQAGNCPGDVDEIVFSADTFIIDEFCGLDLPPNMILAGAAGGGTVLSGNNTNRIFNIENANIVEIHDIEFINGFATGECFLLNNGGAIAMGSFGDFGSNTVIIKNCLFTNNEAVGMGGHIYNAGNSVTTLTIENTTFSGGISGSDGGAITNEAENDNSTANLNLINCRFIGNQAVDFGGAIYNKAMGDGSAAFLYMVNNLLHNNGAAIGGAIAQLTHGIQSGVSAELINCTVADNNASTSGGAFYNQNQAGTFATLNVMNGIVWGNTSIDGPLLRTIGSGATNVFGYSLLQSADCNDAAVSNIGASVTCNVSNIFNIDPQFKNAAGGDYALQLSSPAINFGDNATILATGVTTDLAGLARILETTVDMGAFENISKIPTMGEWGLIILALLMLQGIWYTLVFKPTNLLRDIPAMWIQGMRDGLQDKSLLVVLGIIAVSVLSLMAFFGIAQAADIVGVPMALFIAIPAIFWYKKLNAVSIRTIG